MGYHKRVKFIESPVLAILLSMLCRLCEDSSFITPSCWKVQVVMHFPLLNLYHSLLLNLSCSPEVALSEYPMLQLIPYPSSLPYRTEWDDIRVLGILVGGRRWASEKKLLLFQLLHALRENESIRRIS
jgi:hypothetical protein